MTIGKTGTTPERAAAGDQPLHGIVQCLEDLEADARAAGLETVARLIHQAREQAARDVAGERD